MAFFVPPDIKTDVITLQTQNTPEPSANALQKSFHQHIDVPGDVSPQYLPAFTIPEVRRNYGWQQPQLQEQYQPFFFPQQSPGVQYASVTIPSAWNEAKAPTPTTARTGVIGNLRSPGINEGY